MTLGGKETVNNPKSNEAAKRASGSLERLVSQPRRIQLSRKKGWRLPPNTLNVARPSRYGNPHRIGMCPVCGVTHTRDEAVAEFEAELSQLSANHFEAMRGKNLACWCKLNERCHADVLLRLANAPHKPCGTDDSQLK